MRIVRSRTFWRGIKQARNTSYDTSGTTTTTNGQTKLSMIKGQLRGSELDTGQQKDLSITLVENTPILFSSASKLWSVSEGLRARGIPPSVHT